MTIQAILAVSDNGIIGNNNTLPWRQRDDLKRFKKLTKGSAMLMGRKTFESLPGILPNRKHFVLTRNSDYGIEEANKVEVFLNEGIPNKTMAIASVQEIMEQGYQKLSIIGGAEIYKMFQDLIIDLHVTEIHAQIEGDTKLDLDFKKFTEIGREWHAKDAKNEHDYSFVHYQFNQF